MNFDIVGDVMIEGDSLMSKMVFVQKEIHQKVVEENKKLKEENDFLRGLISDLKQESTAYDQGKREGMIEVSEKVWDLSRSSMSSPTVLHLILNFVRGMIRRSNNS